MWCHEENSDAIRTSFDNLLESRMLLYALVAGATVTCSSMSQAEVLFTPSTAVLPGINHNLSIDRDHDGSADFILRETGLHCSYGTAGRLMAYGLANNGVATDLKGEDAVALRKTARIPAQNPFEAVAFMTSTCRQSGVPGKWENVTNRFLGVKFRIGSEIHYGWIGFRSVNVSPGVYAALGGWAYETEANKAILAGDKGSFSPTSSINPTSLEVLAAGHIGIEERRKRTAP